MPDVIHSRSIEEICGEQDDEIVARVQNAMKDAHRLIEEAAERERKRPHLDFIATAKAAGFSESQAEFLWRNRAHPTLADWKA